MSIYKKTTKNGIHWYYQYMRDGCYYRGGGFRNKQEVQIAEIEHRSGTPPETLRAAVKGLKSLPYNGCFPPCVYFLIYNGLLQYVGQSINLLKRLSEHGDKVWDAVYYLPVPRPSLNQVEGDLIKQFQPPLNIKK